jgi:hypothetical protein
MLMEQRAVRMIRLGWTLFILGWAEIILQLVFGHVGLWMTVVLGTGILIIGIGLGFLIRYYRVQQTLREIKIYHGRLP